MADDSWETPQWLFDELNEEFHFDIDLAATKENTKCKRYMVDYLENQERLPGTDCWVSSYLDSNNHINAAFMNPPYSRGLINKFVEKAWKDSKYCKIVMLLPVRTSTKWWSIFWNYTDIVPAILCGQPLVSESKGPKPGVEIRFFPKRVAFVKNGKEVKGTSFDSCVVVLDRRNK